MDIPLYAMMPAGVLPIIIISKTLLPVCFVLLFFFINPFHYIYAKI